LHEVPERELKLQAIRIGTLGIAAIPDEVFALSGLKIKAQSPLETTFVIELANGSEGYIPPPAQHALGGYTTWPARTAALEVQAEPRIVNNVLGLLEEVSGRPRRPLREPACAYADAVLASKPLAYWRLDEMAGPEAIDATGHGHRATYEGGVAFYLEGPPLNGKDPGTRTINRAPHLAGGHLAFRWPHQGRYSLEFWFWNGLQNTARTVTGDLFTCRDEDVGEAIGDRLLIAGTSAGARAGRLVFAPGSSLLPPLSGATEIVPRTWHHVVLIHNGVDFFVYLDGKPEIDGRALELDPRGPAQFLFGSAIDTGRSLEGKLDEIAVYDRGLTPGEIAAHFASGEADR
jgi:hypothetical protein